MHTGLQVNDDGVRT